MERYKAYSTHLKELYGEKVYKLPVNLPVTCPNRMDGDGCTFCGGVGTGFEAMNSEVSVSEQLNATKGKITKRYKAKKFIAYFQNYTNTFLPLDKFEKYLVEAAQTEDIVGISIEKQRQVRAVAGGDHLHRRPHPGPINASKNGRRFARRLPFLHIKEVQEALCVPEAAPCTNCTTLSTVWRSCTSEAGKNGDVRLAGVGQGADTPGGFVAVHRSVSAVI